MQQPEWKGLQSQKFERGRRHLQVPSQLGRGLQANSYYKPLGLKTFLPSSPQQIQYRSSLKTYEQKFIAEGKQIDLRGKKTLTLPEQIQRKRPQLKHVQGGIETYNQFETRGLRTFNQSANQRTNNEYRIQNKLQRKARILGLQGARNQIGVSSLGDKAYKYPQYAPQFFKSGGLIPGSTNKFYSQRQQFALDDKQLKSVFTKPHWNLKVKMDQAKEDKQYIDSVDEWQKTILKENNPNWNDPQTFFQRLEAQSANNKDAKKAPVKK